MDRQPGQRPPQLRDAGFSAGAEPTEQLQCLRDARLPRRLQPGELQDIPFTPAEELKHGTGQVNPANLRFGLLGPRPLRAFAPEP